MGRRVVGRWLVRVARAWRQRRPGVASLLLAACALAACPAEVNRVPATQTTIRLQADAEVRAALRALRVRTAAVRGGTWVTRSERTFSAEDLRWPVEIVVTPPSEARADERFEFVAEALDESDDVLVQARAITGYVLREQRLLVLALAPCGGRPLGFACEPDPKCSGPACLSCVAGECAQAPWVEPSSLDRFDAASESGPGSEPDEADGAVDLGAGPDELDASVFDASMRDARVAPEAGGPRACDPGSEPDDAGACHDVDECARGLDDCDDDPPACVNHPNGLGFACACPTGYRGTGEGADGCEDIDECAEGTHSCEAPCNNTPGGYACGSCPPGLTPSAGGCADIDECATDNGGCDSSPMATCGNREGAPNTCECPPGYTGNGVGEGGCADVNECTSNNGGCFPGAGCMNRVGAPNTCECPTGFTGQGKGPSGCADIPDCTATSCRNGGRCIEGTNDFSCDCSGTLFTGGLCEIDPCIPNQCALGLTCQRTMGATGATASCVASCAGDGDGCQPGDRCVTDTDCRTGGDDTATCEATAKVCVRVCPATTIVSQANLDAARYCREINGDLKIEPDFPTLGADSLPYLTRVRGSLLAVNPFPVPVQSITLPALQTVDGKVHFTLLHQLTLLNLPRLASAAEFAVAQNPAITRLSIPQLTTVNGIFLLGNLPQLGQVDLGRLRTVTGELRLIALCKLPWSQVQPISALGSAQNIAGIGCCNSSSDRNACSSGCDTCN